MFVRVSDDDRWPRLIETCGGCLSTTGVESLWIALYMSVLCGCFAHFCALCLSVSVHTRETSGTVALSLRMFNSLERYASSSSSLDALQLKLVVATSYDHALNG